MGILLLILLFAFAIIIHEVGHMVVAKLFGVRVFEFSIGFGWKLAGRQIGETEYRISALPLGGYVKMKGMERLEPFPPFVAPTPEEILASPEFIIYTPETLNYTKKEFEDYVNRKKEGFIREKKEEHRALQEAQEQAARDNPEVVLHGCTDKDAFVNRPAWQRFFILVAGVSANLVCAFMFFLIANLSGYNVSTNRVTPVDKLPAIEAGLRDGDRIVEINSHRISDLLDVQRAIKDTKGKPLKVVVKRDGQTLTFTVVPKLVEGNWFIGVKSYGETRKERLGVFESVKLAAVNTVVLPVKFAQGMAIMFSGKVKADDLAGPVGIVHIGSQIYSKRGTYDFLYFCGMLMAALFFFNLLPIPPLDGGHVLYLAIEKVRGKPISIKWKNRATIFFMALLIILTVYVCNNDIQRACSGFQLPS